MSLSESYYSNNTDQASLSDTPVPAVAPVLEPEALALEHLTEALSGLFAIKTAQSATIQSRVPMSAYLFSGSMLVDAEAAYPQIEERFRPLGYTPMLDQRDGQDVITAVKGVLDPPKMKTRLWLHILLFVITLFTTIVAGASFRNVPLQTGTTTNCYIDPRTQRPVCTFNGTSTNQIVKVAQAGAPFAVSLLLILGIHEMGHYIAARRHKIAVTPPYFIPMPVEGSLGTMGAVIMIRSPLTNRKMLFDVGISGPLAGFVVAVIVLLISFSMPIGSRNTIFSGMQLGMPLLVEWMIHLFRPDIRNLSTFVGNNPVALAAWFGMFLTALNLLPIGQLDGGHIMYALFGRKAWTVAIIAAAILIFLGLTGSVFLIIYVVMAYMTGLRHPPPHNDITPLDAKRKWLGYATIVLFFLLATPRPFTTAPVLQLIHIMFG